MVLDRAFVQELVGAISPIPLSKRLSDHALAPSALQRVSASHFACFSRSAALSEALWRSEGALRAALRRSSLGVTALGCDLARL